MLKFKTSIHNELPAKNNQNTQKRPLVKPHPIVDKIPKDHLFRSSLHSSLPLCPKMVNADALRSQIRAKAKTILNPFTREMSITAQQRQEAFIQPFFYTVAGCSFCVAFYFQSFAIAVYSLAVAYIIALFHFVPCWKGLWLSVDEDASNDLPFVPAEEYAAYVKHAKKDPRNAPAPGSPVWYMRLWQMGLRGVRYLTKRKVQ